jgi:uncharacterized protein
MEIIDAVRRGDLEEAGRLLTSDDQNANVHDRDGFTPLMLAAERGNAAMIELLLSHGASVDTKTHQGVTALALACDYKETQRPDRMIMAGEERIYLKWHLRCVQVLLDRNADPNIPNSAGGTALFAALKAGSVEILRLLLSKGANPNHQLPDGSAAIMLASWNGDYEACKALIEAGARVDLLAKNGLGAIWAAEKQGHTAILQLLGGNA